MDGPLAKEYTRLGMLVFRQFAQSGTLPQIYVNGSRTAYYWDRITYVLNNICKQRVDRAELAACTGLTQNELANMFPTEYDMGFNDSTPSNEFDYERFWSSPDDEIRHPSIQEPVIDYLKFFDDN